MPNASYIGVSRRIEAEEDRTALRTMLEQMRPHGMGLIARTVSLGMSREELQSQIDEQYALYQRILLGAKNAVAPALIHSEESLVYRTVRDLFDTDIDSFLISDAKTYCRVLEIVETMSRCV